MVDFVPMLTPEQMLERGVFGGNYFHNASDEDFMHMRPSIVKLALLNQQPYSKALNYYEARAGESYEQWMKNGWIFPEDPLGWFHWYCRFASGRRHHRDAHQIHRHNHYRQRWGRFARSQMIQRGDASNVVKQGLLQWALDPMTLLHGDI